MLRITNGGGPWQKTLWENSLRPLHLQIKKKMVEEKKKNWPDYIHKTASYDISPKLWAEEEFRAEEFIHGWLDWAFVGKLMGRAEGEIPVKLWTGSKSCRHKSWTCCAWMCKLLLCVLPNVNCGIYVFLEAERAAPASAQTLLQGWHEVLQVLGEVLVLVAEEVDLQCCVVDLRAVLPSGHPVQDPQHLHCGVVTRVHQVEEMLHEPLPQKDSQLPGKALVVPQNHIQDHEEAVNSAGVLKVDFDVHRDAWDGLSSCLNGKKAAPREDRPPEWAILLVIVVYWCPNFVKECLRPTK